MRAAMGDAPRFLIVKMSSMGDVIHGLPVVDDIIRAMPQAQIDWVVEEGFSALPRLHPGVRNVLPVALRRWRRSPLALSTWREFRSTRRSVRATRYDRIVDVQGLLKSAWVAGWAKGPTSGFDRASAREPAAARCYDHRFAVARALHAIERNRRLAASAIGYTIEGPPRFTLSVPGLRQGALGTLAAHGPYAVLLTNASRATKLWPVASWQRVEADLAQRGLHSILVWGSEQEGAQTRVRAQGMRAAEIAPRSPLDQLAALLAHARLVVGIDTGLTHLAAAVGAPTVGIFCDYDPALVGLRGAAPCESLGGAAAGPAPEAVLAAIERVLRAAPPRR
jgi:lipopolysaccharide heptosyltransferase I